MRKWSAFLVALALVGAACGQAAESSGDQSAEPEQAPKADASEDAAGQLASGGLFAYAYEPGDSYTYAFELTQDMAISIEAKGDDAFFEGQDEPPGDVAATIAIAGTITYDVAPGPEADTLALSITGTFDDVSVSGTIDGEAIDDELDLAEVGGPDMIDVPNVTVVIDSQGNVVSGEVDGEELDVPEFDLFGNPLSSFEGITSGGLSDHFGPSFPDKPLAVGDTWGDSQSEDVFDQTVTTETSYRVTGFEDVDGAETAVIDISTSFSGVTIDFGQFLSAMFEGFAAMGEELGAEGGETQAVEDLDFNFLIGLEPSEATGTAWFDAVAGLTRRYSQDTSVGMSMDFAIDDGIQKGSMNMDLGFDISLSAELVTEA